LSTCERLTLQLCLARDAERQDFHLLDEADSSPNARCAGYEAYLPLNVASRLRADRLALSAEKDRKPDGL
jgi:hypothetical protein